MVVINQSKIHVVKFPRQLEVSFQQSLFIYYRYLNCTGAFQNMSGEWEALLQGYRMEGVESTFPCTEDLLRPPTDQLTLHDQCKLVSALSNFHYWEITEEKSKSSVGFSRMLSIRDPSGKYKPASPRNRILLALRENNYADARVVFQKFLNYDNADPCESELPMPTNLDATVHGPSKKR